MKPLAKIQKRYRVEDLAGSGGYAESMPLIEALQTAMDDSADGKPRQIRLDGWGGSNKPEYVAINGDIYKLLPIHADETAPPAPRKRILPDVKPEGSTQATRPRPLPDQRPKGSVRRWRGGTSPEG